MGGIFSMVLFAFFLLIFVAVGAVLGILAYLAVSRLRATTDRQRILIATLEERIRALESGAAARPFQPSPTQPPPPAAQDLAAARPAPPPPPPREERPVTPEGQVEAIPRAVPFSFAPSQPPRPPAAGAPSPPLARAEWARQFEANVGKRWIAFVGALLVFFAASLAVKYAFDSGWIRPAGIVAAGLAFGLMMVAVGEAAVRRKMPGLGQGFIGGGLAVLYVTLFAGFGYYHLKYLTQPVAFGALVAVTAGGLALAVARDAMPIRIIAVIGAFLTPLVLGTGKDPRDVLFLYALLVDLGVLGTAFFKQWQGLGAIAFAGTAILYTGWFDRFYRADALAPALAWLAAFFAVFLAEPFAYHFRMRKPLTVERFVIAAANAFFALAFAWWMLYPGRKTWLGFAALILSACYAALAAVVRRRVPDDTRSHYSFAALSVAFLTLAAPMYLGLNGVTIAWAAEAPLVLYIGYRFAYKPLRVAAGAVMAIAVLRLLVKNWPAYETLFTPFVNRTFAAAMWVPVTAWVFAAIHYRWRADASPADRILKVGAALATGVIAAGLVQVEIVSWLYFKSVGAGLDPRYLPWCAAAAVWVVAAAGFAAGGLAARSAPALVVACLALIAGLILSGRLYSRQMLEEYAIFWNVRFAVCLALCAEVFLVARFFDRLRIFAGKTGAVVSRVLHGAAGLFLLVAASAEAYSYFTWTVSDAQKSQWLAQMSLSVLWAVYASAALVVGFWRKLRPLRFAALGLFALTALKVVIVDLAELERVYRIVSFLGLGVLMMAASYLYHRVERRVGGPPETGTGAG